MERNPLLLLIGLRCSGKTTLGQAVASALGLAWADLDSRVLLSLDCRSVGEAFNTHGEAGWRAAEARCLIEVLETRQVGVLSLGGGAAAGASAAAAMRSAQTRGHAVIALLHPGQDELVQRLSRSRGDRPRLADDDAAEVRALAAARLPLYRSMAEACIDTRLPKAACVERLVRLTRCGHWAWPCRPASG